MSIVAVLQVDPAAAPDDMIHGVGTVERFAGPSPIGVSMTAWLAHEAHDGHPWTVLRDMAGPQWFGEKCYRLVEIEQG